MYNIMVPVTNSAFAKNREDTVSELKRFDAVRVMISMPPNYNESELVKLRENSDYLHENGLESCAWRWTWLIVNESCRKIMSATGSDKNVNMVCPSDEIHVDEYCAFVKRIAETGVDMFLFDDDFSLFGFYNEPASCCCDNHIQLVSEKLGEKVSREQLSYHLLNGGENKYRSAWIEVNSDLLKSFARKIRAAADEVNPEMRIGICCSPAAWDFSADISEIAHILAGKTRSFLRLISAPYWAPWKGFSGFRLQDVIEHERMVRTFCGDDIEIVAEGDTCPRPRFRCPATYLENFDMAMRADGRCDGIMKYGIDYVSSPKYETGYADFHRYNSEIYSDIDKYFSSKKACGIYVFENARKYEKMDIPQKSTDELLLCYSVFSRSSRMLAANSVSTSYEYSGYGTIAFGENAKYVPDELVGKGMILDIFAAKNLEDRGIDVGLKKIQESVKLSKEYFIYENECVDVVRAFTDTHCTTATEGYRAELKNGVKLLTKYIAGNEEIPGSYLYENANGQRFMVFLFDGYYCGEHLFRMYSRARQIKNNIKWLCGRDLPAYCGGNPDLYMMCKVSDGKLSVGLWNLCNDPILKPVIELADDYKSIEFINTDGKLENRKVYLNKIASHEFAAFEVK